jgi:hypothetical protein
MIESTTSSGMHYVFTCKPDDHKILMEWVDGLRLLHEVMHMEHVDQKGKTHVCEWACGVPLNGAKDAPSVNFLEKEKGAPRIAGNKTGNLPTVRVQL